MKAGMGRIKAERDVWSHYNAGWQNYLSVAEAALEAEGPHLARILNACLNFRGRGSRKQRGRFRPHIGGEVLSDRINQVCHLAYYMAVIMDTLRSHIPEKTERIVEMGSGWGAVIASYWLHGGPRDAEYWALEYTDTGRRLSDLLAGVEPRFKLKTHAFDYHNADFSFLSKSLETVVYSIYSIEQVTFIKDELIDRILAIPGFTRCVHVEPVGWQTEPDSLGLRLNKLFHRLGMKPFSQQAAATRRCWQHGKNHNLLDTLRRFERAGKIVIEVVERDLVSNDPLNPGTLVVWRKAASSHATPS